MRKLLPAVSLIGLALVLGPVLAYLMGSLDKDTMSAIMLAGTVVWFASVPFWMGRNRS